ncbi:hypothetical protein [Hyunsoonleella pacifica]|uniref:Uncharacterized protein n=1 Tax=Hyunsoonleella pacifica TaxID=1080224 RepID=A0A4Q9FR19_9FLAO|nr:hypothetical protein [Hyunsoonleella pacifica]TBN15709.1 hypothetical protein EYD46_11340 [Hyunsoonleella pacifica]GGD22002.1 hypothetical protein GCM10011368_25060 [Hyunsoonleella pacifica]
MKNLFRFILLITFILIGISVSAQEIKVNDSIYEVKKGTILNNGVDVTDTLSEEEKAKILAEFEKRKQAAVEAVATQKRVEKAEKEQKKSEKKRKKAEKALKQKEKAQSNYNKATKKYQAAQEKYEKLKSKGKLSPMDEKKWLEKIEKLHANVIKTKKKLK